MPAGYGSVGVNDQLVPVPVKAAYSPITMGPAYVGPAMWPRQGVYNLPPVLPSPDLQQTMPPQAWGQSPQSEGGAYMGEPTSPFSLTQSPLWWGLGALIVGLVMLRFVHWRGSS